MTETLYVERIGTDTFTAIWEATGHRDRRVVFPLTALTDDDRPLLHVGTELHWSPDTSTVTIRKAEPPTPEQLARWHATAAARIAIQEQQQRDCDQARHLRT